jgi:hypothetical protein
MHPRAVGRPELNVTAMLFPPFPIRQPRSLSEQYDEEHLVQFSWGTLNLANKHQLENSNPVSRVSHLSYSATFSEELQIDKHFKPDLDLEDFLNKKSERR